MNKNILISAKQIESENKVKKFSEKIQNLNENFKKILNLDKIHEISFANIYNLCYSITIEKMGNLLLTSFHGTLHDYLTELYQQTLIYKNIDLSHFFRKVCEDYLIFIKKIEIIQKTMLYFERSYLDKNNLDDVKETSKKVYQFIFLNEEIKNILITFILENLNKLRENIFIDKLLIKEIISFIQDLSLNIYKSFIEKFLIIDSHNYYQDDFIKNIQNKNCIEFSIYVMNRIKIEEQMIIDLNLNISRKVLMETLSDTLIKNFIEDEDKIIPYIKCLIKTEDFFHIKILKEISQISLYDKFIESFAKSIEIFGNEIIKEKCNKITNNNVLSNEDSLSLIDNLILLLDKIEKIKKDLEVHQHKSFSNLISNKISSFINTKEFPLIIAKTLPKFIDYNFKITLKKNNSENNNLIDKIFNLTKFITDKDVFELNHRRLLSSRLLNGNFNEEIETKFIVKMKLENGAVFTHRLEVMINDLRNSGNILDQYRNSKFYHKNNFNVEFNIKVLTQGNWIINSNENIITQNILSYRENKNLKMIEILNNFNNFFMSFYHNKIIYHNLFLGNCEIIYKIQNRNYFINMIPFQSFFCLIFNKNKSMTLLEIFEFFKIDPKSIIFSIIPLIKIGIFLVNDEVNLIEISRKIKNTQLKEINKDFPFIEKINFKINPNFTSKQQRLKISQFRIQNNEEKEEEKIEPERKYIIESNVIRIMKSKKVIQHNELINEIINNVSITFIPDMNQIKIRIESLIERGYITRSENNFNEYYYSA